MGNTKNTIKIKNYLNVFEEMISDGTAILPGMILEMTSATGANTCKPHATAGVHVAPIMVALEDELQGKTIDDSYAATAGTKVQVWIPQRGDIANLISVDGTALAIGDYVESNGNGRVTKYVLDVDSSKNVSGEYINVIIGQVLETISASSATTEDRVMVRIC